MSLSCRTGDGSEFLMQAKDEVQLWGGGGLCRILGGLMGALRVSMVIFVVLIPLILVGPQPHFWCP